MPSGSAHLKFNLILLLPATVALWQLTETLLLTAVFIIAFLYSTVLASPDMDLAHQIKLFSWKGLLTLPFRFFYAPLVKHRSKISHSLFLGTPGRLLSLAVFLFFFSFLFLFVRQFLFEDMDQSEIVGIWDTTVFGARLAAEKLTNLAWEYKTETGFGLAGFLLADLGHLFLDRFF